MTRAFRIINAKGEMLDLLADLDIFGLNPEGLGVEFDNKTYQSNSNFLLEKSELKPNQFKLGVAFGYVSKDPYQAYHKLAKFLNFTPYLLEYETTAGTWRRECRPAELTKSEIVNGDIMMEQVTLDCMTPWYKEIENKYDPVDDIPGDGKIYQYYDHTVGQKRVYAWAWSEDGQTRFTEIYPNVNLVADAQGFKAPLDGINGADPLVPETPWVWTTAGNLPGQVAHDLDRFGIGVPTGSQWTRLIQYSIPMQPGKAKVPTVGNDNLTVVLNGGKLSISGEFKMTTLPTGTRPADGGIGMQVVVEMNDGTTKYLMNLYPNQKGELEAAKGKWVTASKTYDLDSIDASTVKLVRFSVINTAVGSFVEFRHMKLEQGDPTMFTVAPNDQALPGYSAYPTYYGYWMAPQDWHPGLYPSKPEWYNWGWSPQPWVETDSIGGSNYDLVYDYHYADIRPEPEPGPPMHAYAYDYIYEAWTNGANGVYHVENNSIYMDESMEGSPVEIFIDGPANNPHWTVQQGGKEVASDGYNVRVLEGWRLVVSSIPGKVRAELIAPDGTRSSVYQQQQLDKTNFVRVPVGNSTVTFYGVERSGFILREEMVVV